MDFDNIRSPQELTEEQKNAIELQKKMHKAIILSVTAGVAITIGLGIVTMLLLLHFGVFTFNKNAFKKENTSGKATSQNYTDIASLSTDSKLNELENYMSDYYFGEVDKKKAQDAVCKAYVDSFGDEYSVYYTADEYKTLAQSITGAQFYGIGIYCTAGEEKEGLVINGFSEGSPAEKAGLKIKDIVIEADGKSLIGEDTEGAVSHLRGEADTTVHVKVKRGEELLEFDIKRVEIDEMSVHSAVMDDGKTGYMRISEFTTKTGDQFKSEFDSLTDKGISQLIIDLRNNTGGVVSSAIEILDTLVCEDSYGGMEFKNGKVQEFKGNKKERPSIPYTVLVNEYTASASEIFTANVKDYGSGTVIGTKTFGKGITQRVVMLSDGSAIKYTDAKIISPKGNSWHGEGITPDMEVALSETGENDEQFDAAVDYLNSI